MIVWVRGVAHRGMVSIVIVVYGDVLGHQIARRRTVVVIFIVFIVLVVAVACLELVGADAVGLHVGIQQVVIDKIRIVALQGRSPLSRQFVHQGRR